VVDENVETAFFKAIHQIKRDVSDSQSLLKSGFMEMVPFPWLQARHVLFIYNPTLPVHITIQTIKQKFTDFLKCFTVYVNGYSRQLNG